MSTTQPTQTETASNPTEAEEFVWPEFNPSPGYRGFVERLRLARLERELSIADMSDAVCLDFKLAYEFENLITPLPFCHLEVWCNTVGVPFEDFLAIYWNDEREWQEREDLKLSAQNAPGITGTAAGATEPPTIATAPSRETRRPVIWQHLRTALDRISRFFRSRFSTP